MHSLSNKDRWQLTQETFACLLAALHMEETQAVKRYERLHGRLILFFMRYRSSYPEDLADQVVNRLACKISEGQSIANIEAFALGIARMVALEEQARTLREQRLHLELRRNELNNELTSNKREIALRAMEEQFTALPATARGMLVRYHGGRGIKRIRERQKLAEEMGISIGTLRKRIFDMQALLRLAQKRMASETRETQEREGYL
jgi:DNA-directed RNA polymerase specialized sigma24 family protein